MTHTVPTLIRTPIFKDQRGSFREVFSTNTLNCITFVQDNLLQCLKNSFRGVHVTLGQGSIKYVYCMQGHVIDYAVNLRKNDPDFGKVYINHLDGAGEYALIVPAGYGHGVFAMADSILGYKTTKLFNKEDEISVSWKEVLSEVHYLSDSIELISETDANAVSLNHLKTLL